MSVAAASKFVTAFLAGCLTMMAAADPAVAAGCAFAAQGEGRVAAVLDGRTFRLEDAARNASPGSSRRTRTTPRAWPCSRLSSPDAT
jgi:hypothetical protein